MIKLSNETMYIRFSTDRHQVYAEFQPRLENWPDGEFISVDLLYSRIIGDFIDTAMMNEQTTGFLKEHFIDVIDLFQNSDGKELSEEVRQLKRERAKRLFG